MASRNIYHARMAPRSQHEHAIEHGMPSEIALPADPIEREAAIDELARAGSKVLNGTP